MTELELRTEIHKLEIGQFDWTQAIGMCDYRNPQIPFIRMQLAKLERDLQGLNLKLSIMMKEKE